MISESELRQMTGQQQIIEVLRVNSWKWYGHVWKSWRLSSTLYDSVKMSQKNGGEE